MPVPQVCACRWRTSGLVSPEKIPVHSVAFCSRQEVLTMRTVTTAVSSPYVLAHQGRSVPMHWGYLQGLPFTLGAVAALQGLGCPHSAGIGSITYWGGWWESQDPRLLLLPQCRGIFRCDVSALHGRKVDRAIAARFLCLPAHRREEQSSCWENRNVYQGNTRCLAGAWALFSSFALSFSAFSVLTQGHGCRTQMYRKGFS